MARQQTHNTLSTQPVLQMGQLLNMVQQVLAKQDQQSQQLAQVMALFQAQQSQQLAQVMALFQGQQEAAPGVVPLQMHYAKQLVVQKNTGRSLQGSAKTVTAEFAQQELAQNSWAAAETAYRAVSHTQQKGRVTAFEEFSGWHSARWQALGWAPSALGAQPEELVLYYEAHWTKQHGETVLQGKVYPAPSSLANNISLLAAVFDMAGRTGMHSAQNKVRHAWREERSSTALLRPVPRMNETDAKMCSCTLTCSGATRPRARWCRSTGRAMHAR